jgi:hypothetical protein
MSSTHCIDNVNQVHIQNEDGIEEGQEDNLERVKLAIVSEAYLDAMKHNIEHLQMVVEKFGVLVAIQEL